MHPFKIAVALGAALALSGPTVARAQNAKVVAHSSIPDVSRLEYRSVTLLPTSRWPMREQAKPVPAHLWIVPASAGELATGIGWDGAPYEIKSIGGKADWRADVAEFLAAKNRYALPFEFGGRSVERQLLMQLGAADLQRETAAKIRLYRGNNPQSDYLQNLRDAGVASFAAGQFSQAQLQLQKLIVDWPAKKPTNLADLRPEAQNILADIERRAHDLPRPTEEIAGLIWDLQDVRAYQMSVPGSIAWTENPTIQKLANAGDVAIEPLLETLEHDNRLTLSYYAARVRIGPGAIGSVRDAAQSALEVLLKHRYYSTDTNLTLAQRNAGIAAQIRADWNKIAGQTPVDRVFNTLAQSGQTTERLSEAARELLRESAPAGDAVLQPSGVLRIQAPSPDFFGEPLRARQNPSVSDLLESRIIELSQRAFRINAKTGASNFGAPDNMGGPEPYAFNRAMATANELAVVYAKWQPARALPLLGAQLERTVTFVAKSPPGTLEGAQSDLNRTRLQFLAARINSPYGAEAMLEYGAFLRAQPFGRVSDENYLPLWRFPAEPAMIEAAHALFDAPRQPFESAATWKTGSFNYDSAFRLLNSPLVKTPIFKAAILRALKNKTVIGTLRQTQNDEAQIKVTAWNWGGQSVYLKGRKLENGGVQPLRVCDLVGFGLYEKLPDEDHQSRIGALLDVALPTAKRDARLKQIAALVAQGRVLAEESGINGMNFG